MVDRSDNNYQSVVEQIRKGFEILKDNEFYFYGVFNNCFKLDDMILEAIEDPNDGYRSSLGAICHSNVSEEDTNTFFKKPLAKVILREAEEYTQDGYGSGELFRGWHFIDVETRHKWLEIGTHNCNDYYPYFVFRYIPDIAQTKFPEMYTNYIPFKERHPELLIKFPSWFDGTKIDFSSW